MSRLRPHTRSVSAARRAAVRTASTSPMPLPRDHTAVHRSAPPSTHPSLWHGPVDRGLPLLDQVGVGLAEDLHGWVDAWMDSWNE